MRYLNRSALGALTAIGLIASGAAIGQQRPAGAPSVAPVGDATPPTDLPTGAGPSGTSRTASAERFDEVGYAVFDAHGGAITASGPGLPEGFAEVTDLASGRTVLVKTDDRAATTPGILVALSPAAARLLGLSGSTLAQVRVRQVEPIAADQVALEQGRPAAPRLDAPPILLTGLRTQIAQVPQPGAAKPAITPTPSSKSPARAVTAQPSASTAKPGAPYPAPGTGKPAAAPKAKVSLAPSKPAPTPPPKPAASGKYQVRVGAFSSQANAKSLAARLGGHVSPSGKYWLVELGPFADAAAAKTARDGAAKRGYGDARVIAN